MWDVGCGRMLGGRRKSGIGVEAESVGSWQLAVGKGGNSAVGA